MQVLPHDSLKIFSPSFFIRFQCTTQIEQKEGRFFHFPTQTNKKRKRKFVRGMENFQGVAFSLFSTHWEKINDCNRFSRVGP